MEGKKKPHARNEKNPDSSKRSVGFVPEDNVDGSKASTSKQAKEDEVSPVDEWFNKILASDFDGEATNVKGAPATLPERAKKKSRLNASDAQFKRMSSTADPNDPKTIKKRISFLLPSNTIVRAKRASTLTEQEDLSNFKERLSLHKKRSDRFSSTGRSKTLLDGKKEDLLLPPKQSVASAEIAVEDIVEEITDKERLKQLSSIRSLPIPMKDKRKIRDSILEKMSQPRSESMWSSNQQQVKHFVKAFFSRFEIWSKTLKRIEGRFGTGVVSYFVFLRFLLLLNLVIFLLFTIFVVLPEAIGSLSGRKKPTIARMESNFKESFDFVRPTSKMSSVDLLYGFGLPEDLGLDDLGTLLDSHMSPEFVNKTFHYHRSNFSADQHINISRYCSARYDVLVKNETNYSFLSVIQDILQGTGLMEQTVFFIGYYNAEDNLLFGYNYNMPLAFLCVVFIILVLSVFMMIKFTSKASEESLLSGAEGVHIFSNLIFASWDYCIEDSKTANIKHNSFVLEVKSALLESRRKDEIRRWSASYRAKIITIRCIVHLIIFSMLAVSYYIIYATAVFQMKKYHQREMRRGGFHVLLIQFLCPFVITILNVIMIIIFPLLSNLEKYHYETKNNVTLARYVFLRLTSLIVLVSSFYYEITCEPRDMCGLGTAIECPSPMCWETYVGQQIYKLVIMDVFVYILMTFCYDIPRDFIVTRYRNPVTDFIGRQVFDLPTQVLALLYSQTLGWLGMFFCPLLPLINVLKVVLIYYLKRRSCRIFIPEPVPYKASRSNAIFVLVLFITYFFVLFVLGYSISNLPPSPGCSPFRTYTKMMDALPLALQQFSSVLTAIIRFVFSGVCYVPASILLCLGIYYYLTTASTHQKMSKILKEKLVLKGRDKEFLLNKITDVAKKSI